MNSKQYYFAPDCPMCGQEDAEWKWRGARMSSSAWGHNTPCCSEECGLAYANSVQRWETELIMAHNRAHYIKQEIREIKRKLRLAKKNHSPGAS